MTTTNGDYKRWLTDLKEHIYSSQVKAALKVNAELLSLYWHLGNEILDKEKNAAWGKKLIEKLSKDLLHEFPQVKGLSRANLYAVRQWVLFHTQNSSIVQPPVGQLSESARTLSVNSDKTAEKQLLDILYRVPWKHHLQIIAKCKNYNEALFYITESAKHNWSCTVLVHQIESDLWQRKGKAITNFKHTLPAPQSDLAREVIKDPYAFDFLP